MNSKEPILGNNPFIQMSRLKNYSIAVSRYFQWVRVKHYRYVAQKFYFYWTNIINI